MARFPRNRAVGGGMTWALERNIRAIRDREDASADSASIQDRRAGLDLQITLLIDHHLTRIGALLIRMADRPDVPAAGDPAMKEAAPHGGP